MKIKLLLSFLLMATFVKGQNIINGSFEKNIGGCQYGVPDTSFTGYLQNCYEFGIANQIDIMHDSCSYGTAQHGEYFVGLGVNNGPDAMSMQLDTPLTAGTTYQLSFYKKLNPGYVGSNIIIGYSTDSLSLGTIVDTVNAPLISSWVQQTVNFTPLYSARFISVELVNAFYAWDHVDNFTIQTVTGLPPDHTSDKVKLFPNPFSDKTFLQFKSMNTSSVSLKMYNTLGAEIKPLISISNNSIEINRQGLNRGIYVLKVFDNNTFLNEFKLVVM